MNDPDPSARDEGPEPSANAGGGSGVTDARARLRALRHELRTPLNQIIGYSELLQEELTDRGQDDLVPDLERITRAGKRLLASVDELSAIASPPSGPLDATRAVPPPPQPDSGTHTLEGMAGPTLPAPRPAAEPSPARATAVVGTPLPVVAPLVDATVTAPAAVGGPIQTDPAVVARTVEPRITAVLAPTLPVSTPVEDAYVRDLSPALGTTLPVSTQVGGGAGADSPAGPLSIASSLLGDAIATGRLLVVDDEELNRDMLARRLERLGYQVRQAGSGREAIDAIVHDSFDLVLLDVMMPEISGLEVLTHVRGRFGRAELPIIMVTARDASEDVVLALELGANDYLTKPVDFAVARARVSTQLALKRARDELGALNERLRAAQERIDELVESVSDGVEDVHGWATAMAAKVADAIGVPEIEVVFFGEADPSAEATCDARASLRVSREELRELSTEGRLLQRPGRALVPVRGQSPDLRGVLVVHGQSEGWSDPNRRLVESFARQVGSAVELRQLRQQLDESQAQRLVRRRDMLERGIDLLRLCPKCRRCYDQRTDHCGADGAELEAEQPFPFRINGRYRLTQIRGEGGMGMVYQAHDERLDRCVAVKVIKSEHFHEESLRRRFEHEARVVARIDHPGVVAVHDSGELDDGTMFIVMEWLRGRDVSDMLRSRGVGRPAEIAHHVRGGAAALEAAHAADLVHRDIKPENVFLVPTADGFAVKLLDFGVAKDMVESVSLTQTGAIVGTPLFMAPEQLLQKGVDGRSDLYSLAAVVYQALTGRRVTLAEEFAEILVDVLYTMPPPVSAVLDGATPELDRLLLGGLAKSPSDRPSALVPWAEELALALEQLPSDARGWLTESGQLELSDASVGIPSRSPTAATRVG